MTGPVRDGPCPPAAHAALLSQISEEELETELARRRMQRAALLEHCTGIAASWCPVHGTCACPETDEDGYLADRNHPDCPLHASTSDHAEVHRG